MQYEVMLEKGDKALIVRGVNLMEYAVVSGLNKERGDWAATCCYFSFAPGFMMSKEEALSRALDAFRYRTEENYITRDRLVELATLFKDGLLENDEETADIYFREVCDMDEKELEWFGLKETEEE